MHLNNSQFRTWLCLPENVPCLLPSTHNKVCGGHPDKALAPEQFAHHSQSLLSFGGSLFLQVVLLRSTLVVLLVPQDKVWIHELVINAAGVEWSAGAVHKRSDSEPRLVPVYSVKGTVKLQQMDHQTHILAFINF